MVPSCVCIDCSSLDYMFYKLLHSPQPWTYKLFQSSLYVLQVTSWSLALNLKTVTKYHTVPICEWKETVLLLFRELSSEDLCPRASEYSTPPQIPSPVPLNNKIQKKTPRLINEPEWMDCCWVPGCLCTEVGKNPSHLSSPCKDSATYRDKSPKCGCFNTDLAHGTWWCEETKLFWSKIARCTSLIHIPKGPRTFWFMLHKNCTDGSSELSINNPTSS